MSGLDKIISGIELEAKEAADRVTDEARREAARITARADEAAAEIEKSAEADAELEYKRLISRAESAGEVESGRAVLREKQRIITSVMDRAMQAILSSTDKEYFAFMAGLLKKYARAEKGEIVLTAADKKRMPDDFKATLKQNGLTLSDKDGDFDGGFILVYGDIEENCTMTALMETESDTLHDAVSGVLF